MTETPEDLALKIKEARARENASKTSSLASKSGEGKNATSTGMALRAATDLVAALGVGGFLGYWLDHWMGTKPWMMILFLFIGFAAGFLNIYRAQMGQDYKIGFKPTDKKE